MNTTKSQRGSIKITFKKINGEKVAVKLGTFDILCRYKSNGKDVGYVIQKQDTFFLYKDDGELASLVSKSKNPYDFDTAVLD